MSSIAVSRSLAGPESTVTDFTCPAASTNASGFVASKALCAPLLGIRRYDNNNVELCTPFNDSVLAFIQAKHIRNVFLHARWGLYCEGNRYKQEEGSPVLLTANRHPEENYHEFESLFHATIEELRRRQVNVVIIASVPEVGMDVPTVLARSRVKGVAVELEPRPVDKAELYAKAQAEKAAKAEKEPAKGEKAAKPAKEAKADADKELLAIIKLSESIKKKSDKLKVLQ